MATALATFRRLPTPLLVALGLYAVVGAVVALLYATRDAVAMCGDRVMAPGDTCSLRVSRRSLEKRDWTYEQRLDFSAYENRALTVAGIVVAVIAVAMIVAVLVRRARDVAVADRLAAAEEPIAAHARPNGLLTGVLTLGACIAGGIAGLLAVRSGHGDGVDAVPLVIAVGLAGGAVALLVAGRPAGSTLVWAYPDAVRIVTRSTVHDIAWQDMQYTTSLAAEPVTMLSWVGKKDRLIVDDADFFATMRGRINEAVRAGVPERLTAGETIDFRVVKVAGGTVTLNNKQLPGADIAGVVAVRNKDGDFFEFRDAQDKRIEAVRVPEVGNIDVLVEVLSRQFGVGLQRG